MLGADHTGYVGRYKALVAAMGDDPDTHLEILIGQLVNLLRDGEPVRMSKRAGIVVNLADLVDAIGADAARYALARASIDQQIDLDLDLWSRQTNDNPVFYVQYAHARISSVLRNAADLGLSLGEAADVDVAQLAHERETDLLRAIGEFPRVLDRRRRTARAAPGRPLPGGARRHLPPLLRRLPGPAARRRGTRRR